MKCCAGNVSASWLELVQLVEGAQRGTRQAVCCNLQARKRLQNYCSNPSPQCKRANGFTGFSPTTMQWAHLGDPFLHPHSHYVWLWRGRKSPERLQESCQCPQVPFVRKTETPAKSSLRGKRVRTGTEVPQRRSAGNPFGLVRWSHSHGEQKYCWSQLSHLPSPNIDPTDFP